MKSCNKKFKKVEVFGRSIIVCDDGRCWMLLYKKVGTGSGKVVRKGWGIMNFTSKESMNNYYSCMVRDRNTGSNRMLYLHRLLAMCFVENPNGYTEVDHINRDNTDNRIQNLRWCTRSENNRNRDPWKGYPRRPSGCPIQCVETGEVYNGPTDAMRKLGIHSSLICRALKNPIYTCHGCHWVYI